MKNSKYTTSMIMNCELLADSKVNKISRLEEEKKSMINEKKKYENNQMEISKKDKFQDHSLEEKNPMTSIQTQKKIIGAGLTIEKNSEKCDPKNIFSLDHDNLSIVIQVQKRM